MSSSRPVIVPFHEREKTESIGDTEFSDRQPLMKSLEQIQHVVPTSAIVTMLKPKSKGLKRKGILDAKNTLQQK
jgi:hypothetical protein